MRRSTSLVPLAALLLALGGCAHVVVDADGTRHVAGFMILTLPPAKQQVGADALRMRTFGLALAVGHAAGAHVVLGYSDTTVAALRNDSAISRQALLLATDDALAAGE